MPRPETPTACGSTLVFARGGGAVSLLPDLSSARRGLPKRLSEWALRLARHIACS